MLFTQKKEEYDILFGFCFWEAVKQETKNASYAAEHIIICRKQTAATTNTLIKKRQNAAQSAHTFYVPIKLKESKLTTLPSWTGASIVNKTPTRFLGLHKNGEP